MDKYQIIKNIWVSIAIFLPIEDCFTLRIVNKWFYELFKYYEDLLWLGIQNKLGLGSSCNKTTFTKELISSMNYKGEIMSIIKDSLSVDATFRRIPFKHFVASEFGFNMYQCVLTSLRPCLICDLFIETDIDNIDSVHIECNGNVIHSTQNFGHMYIESKMGNKRKKISVIHHVAFKDKIFLPSRISGKTSLCITFLEDKRNLKGFFYVKYFEIINDIQINFPIYTYSDGGVIITRNGDEHKKRNNRNILQLYTKYNELLKKTKDDFVQLFSNKP